MNQRLLFEPNPPRVPRRLAANRDPDTSRAAAADHVRSGRHASQKEMVLEAVRRWPDSTSAELAARLNVSRYLVARRLPDLLAEHRVQQLEPRRCTISGRPAVTWRESPPSRRR